MKIYVHREGKNYGPYSVSQLKKYLHAGNFIKDDLACHDGANWVKLSEVPGIVETPEPVSKQPILTTKKLEATPKAAVNTKTKQESCKPVRKSRKKIYILSGALSVSICLIGFVSYFFWATSHDPHVQTAYLGNVLNDNSSLNTTLFEPHPAAQKIDDFLNAHLKSEGLEPNPIISDDVFLRRVYLSIIGRIPTIVEANDFLHSTSQNKHSILIQKLLSNDAGYTAHHFQFWADILRLRVNVHWSHEYKVWIKEQIRINTRYDDLVRKLVSGHGLVFDNPAAGYYIRDTGMDLDNMSNTARIFLGTRMECAQCHDHPFDKWTQMDFFRMAAFTYGFDHRGGNANRTNIHTALREEEEEAYRKTIGIEKFPKLKNEEEIDKYLAKSNITKFIEQLGLTKTQFRKLALRGIQARTAVEQKNESTYGSIGKLFNMTTYLQVRHLNDTQLRLPHDYQYEDGQPNDPVEPATLFGGSVTFTSDPMERKNAYANWLTGPENPRFTRVIVNRIWKRTFGHGIFEPVDNLTDRTSISQPELLDFLEDLMRELDYDIRAFQAVLFNTKLFRREMHGEDHPLGKTFHFPGPLMTRMSAEQIWDSIATLVLPDIDTHNPNRSKDLERMARMRATYHSLNGRPLEEVLPRMKKVGELRQKFLDEQRNYENDITSAYNSGNITKAKKLTEELKSKLKEMEKRGREIVLVDLKDGQAMNSGISMMMEQSAPAQEEVSHTRLLKAKPRKAPEGLDKNERSQWDKRERANLQEFRETAKQMARAVMLNSPAPRGHFLRAFGQSDREMIENAISDASVPQALYLLNSSLSVAIHNPNSVLGTQLIAASSPSEKFDLIYRSMLTRPSNDRETARILTDYEKYQDETTEDLVWALLNSPEFLFIQ
jgi:hypothetical protein